MKKLLWIVLAAICLVLPLGIGRDFAAAADTQYMSVVATECFLYENPSFDTKVTGQSGEPIVLKHGDRVELLSGGQESEKFLYIGYGDYAGYVFKYYLTSNTSEQDVYPVFNASVAVESAQVYDLQKQDAGLTLEKGQELYLYEGYKKSEEFTAVCFVLQDSSLFYGYLKTTDLQPYGINAGVITGIVAAASCITIILLLLFMKKTKKKKADKK